MAQTAQTKKRATSKGAKPSTKSKTSKPASSRSSKAKLPLVAGGAAIAGAAGGIALASRQGRKNGIASALRMAPLRKPLIKIDSGDVARAAKEMGSLSAHVGELATELQRARESAENSKHRSPVEVVLQGLTARR
jgi:hypothetical protein